MADDGPGYSARALRCRACEARDGASRQFVDGGGDSAGIYFTVDVDHTGGE